MNVTQPARENEGYIVSMICASKERGEKLSSSEIIYERRLLKLYNFFFFWKSNYIPFYTNQRQLRNTTSFLNQGIKILS